MYYSLYQSIYLFTNIELGSDYSLKIISVSRELLLLIQIVSCISENDPKGGPDDSCINDVEIVQDLRKTCHEKVSIYKLTQSAFTVISVKSLERLLQYVFYQMFFNPFLNFRKRIYF